MLAGWQHIFLEPWRSVAAGMTSNGGSPHRINGIPGDRWNGLGPKPNENTKSQAGVGRGSQNVNFLLNSFGWVFPNLPTRGVHSECVHKRILNMTKKGEAKTGGKTSWAALGRNRLKQLPWTHKRTCTPL